MLTTLIALSLVMTPGNPDGVITTAPGGAQSVVVGAMAPVVEAGPGLSLETFSPHGLSTEEQIERWVGSRVSGSSAFGSGVSGDGTYSSRMNDPFGPVDDRKLHGEVTAGIGTGDYSSFGARVSIPFGDSGRLDLSYGQSRNSPWGYGRGFGLDGGFDPRFGPGYRSYYDPFFMGRGHILPGSPIRTWRERETLIPESQDGLRPESGRQD